jgi:addiction module RelE/StbE family toxin
VELRWTEAAVTDLERIADYLFENAPDRAADLVRIIYTAPHALLKFPLRGRAGKKDGTRELVLAPLPYIVVYTVAGDVIHVVRILHAAQQWP